MRKKKLENCSVTPTFNEIQSTEVMALSSVLFSPFYPNSIMSWIFFLDCYWFLKGMQIFASAEVKAALPALHYNSNIALPIKANSSMLH